MTSSFTCPLCLKAGTKTDEDVLPMWSRRIQLSRSDQLLVARWTIKTDLMLLRRPRPEILVS